MIKLLVEFFSEEDVRLIKYARKKLSTLLMLLLLLFFPCGLVTEHHKNKLQKDGNLPKFVYVSQVREGGREGK